MTRGLKFKNDKKYTSIQDLVLLFCSLIVGKNWDRTVYFKAHYARFSVDVHKYLIHTWPSSGAEHRPLDVGGSTEPVFTS